MDHLKPTYTISATTMGQSGALSYHELARTFVAEDAMGNEVHATLPDTMRRAAEELEEMLGDNKISASEIISITASKN